MALPTINKLLTPYNFSNGNASRIKYIVIHYVGALGGAKDNCSYYASKYIGASAHYYVGFSGEIWQSVEDANIGWAVGASSYVHAVARNSNTLHIEMCVRKKSTSTMNATDKDWYFEAATVATTIELTKYLMNKYGIPASNVLRHYDITGKTCPNPYVYNTTSYTWTAFKAALTGASASVSTPVATTTEMYRVRKTWADSSSQLGAYTSKDNAIKSCPNGYKVFDKDGKAVYTAPVATGTQATSLKGLTEANAIKKVASLYTDSQKKTSMLASVGLAQFCLESGYGTTDLAQGANNMHGMKASLSGNTWAGSVWDGKSVYTKKSAEQKADGTEYYEKADFRKYPCIEDSIADRAAYFKGAMNGSNKRYPNIDKQTDPKKAAQIIKDGKYATDVNYVSKICNLIEKWNLTQYDVTTSATNSSTSTSTVNTASSSTDTSKSYKVNVTASDLRIRTNAGTNYASKGYTGKGTFTIVKEKKDSSGKTWGLLKSYEKSQNGWIALWLNCVKKI